MSYPVLLRLTNQRIAFIGGGSVAARKISDLLAAGARVTVVSPELHPRLIELREVGEIMHLAQPYMPGLLAELRPLLVFAATDNPTVNRAVADEAEELGILVNVVDHSAESRFSSMVTVQRPPITVALATDGTSPALAAHLKARLEDAVGDEYALLARWLGELRPLVKSIFPTPAERQQFWESVIASEALDLLRRGETNMAFDVVQSFLAERQAL